MALITLCPPAIAQGADVNPMTREQVMRECKEFFDNWGRPIRLSAEWLAELDDLYREAHV